MKLYLFIGISDYIIQLLFHSNNLLKQKEIKKFMKQFWTYTAPVHLSIVLLFLKFIVKTYLFFFTQFLYFEN